MFKKNVIIIFFSILLGYSLSALSQPTPEQLKCPSMQDYVLGKPIYIYAATWSFNLVNKQPSSFFANGAIHTRIVKQRDSHDKPSNQAAAENTIKTYLQKTHPTTPTAQKTPKTDIGYRYFCVYQNVGEAYNIEVYSALFSN